MYYLLFYVKAKVNVPGLSERTIRRDIAAGDFTITSDIQVNF